MNIDFIMFLLDLNQDICKSVSKMVQNKNSLSHVKIVWYVLKINYKNILKGKGQKRL